MHANDDFLDIFGIDLMFLQDIQPAVDEMIPVAGRIFLMHSLRIELSPQVPVHVLGMIRPGTVAFEVPLRTIFTSSFSTILGLLFPGT